MIPNRAATVQSRTNTPGLPNTPDGYNIQSGPQCIAKSSVAFALSISQRGRV